MPHDVFDAYAESYDQWYDDHRSTYLEELKLIGKITEVREADLEVGVGTGRFAVPLGIRLGIDPSLPMLRIARTRGVETIRGIAEALPLRDNSLGSILVMTSLCYFDDPSLALREIARVLAPGGRLVIGFLGRGGETAGQYLQTREKGRFLAYATLYTPGEVISMLAGAGFSEIREQAPGQASVRGFHVITARRSG